jgi:hypothetical protein
VPPLAVATSFSKHFFVLRSLVALAKLAADLLLLLDRLPPLPLELLLVALRRLQLQVLL